jgi:tetratricopeptide (TPR) repeat protein
MDRAAPGCRFVNQKNPIARSRRDAAIQEAVPLDLSRPIQLAVLSLKETVARCRKIGTEEIVLLRATRLWTLFPGAIAMVQPRRQWKYGGQLYLSGTIESVRLDIGALDLCPLRLEVRGQWDPKEHEWREADEPKARWERAILAWGPRPEFEMEQVLPGEDPEDAFSDPILDANDRKDAGDFGGAYQILMNLCQTDLRCLDAHAHLGNLVFERRPQDALHHYEVGLRIGELSLPEGFEGLLPWGWIDNRPFLRCMSGFGLCLWRTDRFEEAGRIFDRMLWLNPSDNQGVRFLIDDVHAHIAWKDRRDR